MSLLDALKRYTVVVADTGDIDAVRALKPEDCTTNPSIVLKAVQSPAFADHLARETVKWRDIIRTAGITGCSRWVRARCTSKRCRRRWQSGRQTSNLRRLTPASRTHP